MLTTQSHATQRARRSGSLCALLLMAGLVNALPLFADEQGLSGTLQAEIDGELIDFPSLKTDIDVDVSGDLARVRVTQRFQNPLQSAVHARYLFPLNKNAAVYGLTMNVGNERVVALIKEKTVAKKIFTKAKREGKAAALLTQQRPNMFTQKIANLMPNLPIEVVIEYTEALARVDDAYELVMPLVVGPRFNPDHGPNLGSVAHELQQFPAPVPVIGMDLPEHIAPERVSINLKLRSAVGFGAITSATHSINVDTPDGARRVVSLASESEIPNRDFVLRYRLGSDDTTTAGALGYMDERGGFFSLLLEPPASWQEDAVIPREMVFLLDCSGSMGGAPINASKRFMESALRNLRPSDSFRIIRFSDRATEFSTQPLPATATNIAAGIHYTRRLTGSGGTVMRSGIEQALGVPKPMGAVRNVVFLTDGYIGNELEILRLVASELGAARLFALGVGSGVNRYLLDELARVGRGFVRYLDPTKAVDEQADALASRLQTPLLTDITIDWGELRPSALTPQAIPDLYAGDSIRVQGRYAVAGRHTVNVHGTSGGSAVTIPLEVNLPDASSASDGTGEAIPLVWARGMIKQAMHQLSVPQNLRREQQSDESLRTQVTQLGLEYSLVTNWTAFVAVSEQIYNPDTQTTRERPVPQALVQGVSKQAYASAPHGGYAAPEPGTWLGIGLLIALFGLRAWVKMAERLRTNP